jgi:hypothetical protein
MSNTLDGICILEDDRDEISMFNSCLGEVGVANDDYVIVRSAPLLRSYLERGQRAKLYLLDDKVPGEGPRSLDRRFIENYNVLMDAYPVEERDSVVVVYTGSDPTDEIRAFCAERGIEVIPKDKLLNVFGDENILQGLVEKYVQPRSEPLIDPQP